MYAECLFGRGTCHDQLQNGAAALEDFSTAIALSPNLAGAYFNRGQIYGMRGDKDRALADYVQARQLDRQFPPPPTEMYEHYEADVTSKPR